jgi:hypothetical protein
VDEWPWLIRYLDKGVAPIDDNLTGNAIAPSRWAGRAGAETVIEVAAIVSGIPSSKSLPAPISKAKTNDRVACGQNVLGVIFVELKPMALSIRNGRIAREAFTGICKSEFPRSM